MQYHRLGQSGLNVSVLGLGTNAFGRRADARTATRVIHHAIDAGITLIDTANIYCNTLSETIIGDALKSRRHDIILATKVGLAAGGGPNDFGGSRHHILRELEGSLKRLQTDYIDLYQIHTFDPATPLEETLRALDDMVRAGKVRYIGASNYAAWELCRALSVSERYGWARYVSIQPSYSLVDRTPERELVPLCRTLGVGIIAYYPLAGGILTGKYRPGQPPPAGSRALSEPRFESRLSADRLQMAETLIALAQELGKTPAQLALAWLAHRPALASAIAGATRPEQVAENVGALDIPWTDALQQRLDEASQPFIYGPPFAEYRLGGV